MAFLSISPENPFTTPSSSDSRIFYTRVLNEAKLTPQTWYLSSMFWASTKQKMFVAYMFFVSVYYGAKEKQNANYECRKLYARIGLQILRKG